MIKVQAKDQEYPLRHHCQSWTKEIVPTLLIISSKNTVRVMNSS